ncbi:hypothetical protein MCAP1_001209 [Malassezia caprae]|uniref:Transcription factor 25 n=1 Tax=Malassezia caprae TaxID=1381934 RepID=A0AAF0IUT3_9BASI|nr:hypothetical protein MCAP1_001209 [Malassezia caprae]
MSRRLQRRQQRQQQELEQLQAVSSDVAQFEASETPEPVPAEPVPRASAFAAVRTALSPQLDVSDGEAPDAADEEAADAPAPAPRTKPNKKKKKKSGKSTNVNELSLEEMDALLASEAQKAVPSARPEASPSEAQKPLHTLLRGTLALEPGQLDPQLELKRQFGAAAIKAYEREKGHGPSRSGARSRENRGAVFNSNTRARTVLCTPKAQWPDLARTFVGMSMETHDTSSGRVCTWVHSRAYRQAQFQFAQAVSSLDTQSLYALMRVFPWHIDTLLQLSDISRYQGDLGQAADFIDRALFALERSASPPFTAGLTSSAGPPLCDFMRAENRAFWLAAHRNIDLFGRRGTWRTALEWCKLVLGLDTTDPHGMLLWIDFLAVKSKQTEWLLAFLDAYEAWMYEQTEQHMDNVRARTPLDHEKAAAQEAWHGALDWSVGLCYARALAMRSVNKEAGRAALRLAMARHPRAAILLADKLDVSVLPDVVRTHPMQGSYSASAPVFGEMLAHLYVHRSLNLWKEPALTQWFKDTAAETWEHLTVPVCEGEASAATKMGVYRHIVVADLPESLNQQLVRYFPPEVRSPPGGVETFDPLPPVGGSRYDDAYFAGIRGQLQDRSRLQMEDVMQQLQHLNMHDVEQVLDHLDNDTRDFLLQAMGHVQEGEPAEYEPAEPEPQAASEDRDDSGDAAGADAEAETAEPSILQRAWNALWGAS